MGTVEVFYSTLAITQDSPYLSVSARADLSDFLPANGSVMFDDGIAAANFTVAILDDDQPEPEEAIIVQITAVRLVSGSQQRARKYFAAIGEWSTECISRIPFNS